MELFKAAFKINTTFYRCSRVQINDFGHLKTVPDEIFGIMKDFTKASKKFATFFL
jgi:hypothetical protein